MLAPQSSPSACSLVSLASCRADPTRALVQGVLQPLLHLHSLHLLPTSPLLLVVDGLCEAEQHRPDTGPTVLAFLAATIPLFPPWLRVIATCRSAPSSSLSSYFSFHPPAPAGAARRWAPCPWPPCTWRARTWRRT